MPKKNNNADFIAGPKAKALLEKRIKEILELQLGIAESEITANASFQDDLGADSLDVVEIIVTVEDEFKIVIDDEDAEELKTVGRLVEYVTKLIEKAKP